MNINFKYIFVLIILSFMISKMCFILKRKYEGFTLYNDLYESTNPELAGSIDIENNIEQNTFNELVASQLLRYNSLIEYPQNAGSLEINTESKCDPNNDKKELPSFRYHELPSDYMRYEVILPDNYQYKDRKYYPKKEDIIDYIDDKDKVHQESTDNVKERSKLGRVINPDNDCQGSWSDWNTEFCGENHNRCGIKYKKYTITEIEKSDETGDGRPCPYKDGEIKYKYCQGETNIDRCGSDDNLCNCILDENSKSVLEGENVYDISNTCDFKTDINCICPSGYDQNIIEDSDICRLIPGQDCSLNDSGCIYNPPDSLGRNESCSMPPFLNRNTERLFMEKYDDKKGKCTLKECFCENGTPVNPLLCDYPGQHKCNLQQCDDGYVMEGYPLRCVEKVSNKCNCPYGSGADNYACSGDGVECIENSCDEDNSSFIEEDLGIYKDDEENNPYYNKFEIWGNYCKQKNNQCTFSNIDSLNIVNNNVDPRLVELLDLTLGQIMDVATDTGVENVEEILNHQTPKTKLIEEILKIENDNDLSLCIVDGDVYSCQNHFRCKDGYSFVPHNEYEDDDILKLKDCDEDDLSFNGLCLPISCKVTNEMKQLYDISYDTCLSTSENCNTNNLQCKDPTYNDGSSLISVNCVAPLKVRMEDLDSIDVTVNGCSIPSEDTGPTPEQETTTTTTEPSEPSTPNPINCVGSFGECDINCEKTYTINTPAQYGGNSCPHESGYKATCSPEDDSSDLCVPTCSIPDIPDEIEIDYDDVSGDYPNYRIGLFNIRYKCIDGYDGDVTVQICGGHDQPFSISHTCIPVEPSAEPAPAVAETPPEQVEPTPTGSEPGIGITGSCHDICRAQEGRTDNYYSQDLICDPSDLWLPNLHRGDSSGDEPDEGNQLNPRRIERLFAGGSEEYENDIPTPYDAGIGNENENWGQYIVEDDIYRDTGEINILQRDEICDGAAGSGDINSYPALVHRRDSISCKYWNAFGRDHGTCDAESSGNNQYRLCKCVQDPNQDDYDPNYHQWRLR